MNPFPEEHELISIFESEPRLLDAEIPWYYNTIIFHLQRNDDILSCCLSPAYKTITLGLSTNGRKIYDLGFENVKGIHIEKDSHYERLIIEMDNDNPFVTLILQTKPSITLTTTHDDNFRK